MHPSSHIVLKALLNASPLKEGLTKYLPPSDLEIFHKISLDNPFDLAQFDTTNILGKIHYSWFVPTLNSVETPQDRLILLSALSSSLQKRLKSSLNIEKESATLSDASREYIHLILLSSLIGEEDTLLPIAYLPPSRMNLLLTLNKTEVMQLIDFLGLYDLAPEMKKIVDTKTIRLIFSYLTDHQKNFLKAIQTYQAPSIPPLMLKEWDKEKESFHKLLHKKGLHRLAIALCTSHTDLLWYVSHFLDSGRGNTLIKLSKKKENSKMITIIRSHVFDIIHLMRKQ